MAHRVQPQTDPGNRDYNYGYTPSGGGGGAHRIENTGGFGPDANAIYDRGQSSFRQMYERISQAAEEEEKNRPETAEATPLDRFMGDLYDLGDSVTPPFIQDMQQSDNLIIKGAGVIMGAPLGTIGALPQGVAQGYEAAFGRGVTRDGQDEDTVELLDANERAASGVNAAINVGGMFLGGTGRAVKGLYRAGRTVLGDAAEEGVKRAAANALEDVGEGFIRGGGWKDVVGDMAEEAGEEFVQSLADDARYGTSDEGSLGRALESAAWGAVGGGAMSGLGYGLNKFASRNAKASGSDADDPSSGLSDVADNDSRRLQYGDDGEKRYVTNAVQEAVARRVEGRAADWPGSRSATLMQTNDKSQGINEGKMGVDSIRNIWLAKDDGKSAKVIEDAFGLTHEDATKLFSSEDWSQQIKDIFANKRNAGEKVTFYWARNPATKGRQPVMTDLVDLFDGDGVMLHALVLPLVGADVDGDKMFITLSDEATENARYATSLLIDPETGNGTISADDWMRTGIGSNISKKTIGKVIGDTLSKLSRTYKNREGKDVTVDARNSIDRALKNNNSSLDDLYQKISDAISSGVDGYAKAGEIIDSIGSDARDAGFDKDAVIQEIVRNLATDEESSMAASIDAIISSVPDLKENAPDFQDSEVAPAAGIPGSGSTPANYSYSQMLVDWNQLVFAETETKGNPPFRQYGEMGYKGKSVPSYVSDSRKLLTRIVDLTSENFNSNDKLNNFLVACLKERSRGSNVDNAIETKLNSYIRSRVITRTGLTTHRIASKADFEVVLKEFVEARVQAVEWAKAARKRLTNMGWRTDASSPLMGELKFDEGNYLSDMKLMGEFARMFGDSDPSNLFDTHAFPQRYEGMTLNEIVRDIDNAQYSSGTELIAAGSDMVQIFDALAKSLDANRVIVSNAIKVQIDEITSFLYEISRNAKNGVVSRNDLALASFMLNAINEIVGADASLNIGMYDPSTFLRSRWGQEIASGDKNRAVNSVLSMTLTGQFDQVIKLFKEAGDDQFKKNYAISRANEMAKISKLHELIAVQLMANDGKSDLLNYFTDLDISWEQKAAEFGKMFDTNDGKNDLLLMALTDKVSEFDLTDINARRRRAKSSYNSGRKVSYQNALNDVNALQTSLETGAITEQILCAAIEDAVSECYIEMDNAALAMMIIDADNFGNQSLEKATLELAPQLYGQGVEVIANGGMKSEVDHAVNETILRMPLTQFTRDRNTILGVLSGRIKEVYVYDSTGGIFRDKRISRDTIFGEYVSGWVEGSTPTAHDWLCVLRGNPQFASMIAPHEVQQRVIEGTPNTSSAISETLSSYVKGYAERYNATGPDNERAAWIANSKRKIRNRIRRIRGLPSIVALMIPDLDTKINDPRALQASCDDAMNAIVDAAFDKAMLHETGDAFQKLKLDEEIESLSAMMNDLMSCIKNAQILSMSMDMNSQMRSDLEKQSRVFMADVMYRMAADALIRQATSGESTLVSGAAPTVEQLIDFSGSTEFGASVLEDMSESKALDGMSKSSEKFIENTQTELMNMMSKAMAIYKIVFEFSDRTTFDTAFNPDSDVVNAIKSSIDANDSLTADQKQEIKDRLGSISGMLTSMTLDVELSDVVTDADVNPALSGKSPDQMKADLKAKARRIWSGSQNKYNESIDKQIDEAIDGTGDNPAQNRIRLKRVLDAEYLGNFLREMRNSTGARLNGNALNLWIDWRDMQREIEREARIAVDSAGTTDITIDGQRHKYPPVHILNPRIQAISTKLNSTDVPAGVVSARTGVNGSQFRTNGGYAVLPRNRVCKAAPRRMTVAEIVAATNDPDNDFDPSRLHYARQKRYDPNWTYDPDGRGKTWTLDTFTPEMIEGMLAGNNDADQVWFVFVTDDCDDGLCVAHQKTPHGGDSKGYLSVPNIINRITQYAQEAMNIKQKKKPSSVSFLGHETYQPIYEDKAVVVSSGQDGSLTTDSIDSMASMFTNARKKVENHLTRWLTSEDMEDLGYGRDQAKQLSLVMVQGLRVTFNGANGPVVRIVPASAFMVRTPNGSAIDYASSQAAFAQYLQKLRESTGDPTLTPQMAQESMMTLDELSTRAMWNVINNYEDGLSKRNIENLALEGMTNLDNIKAGELELTEVLSQITPVGMAFDNVVQSSTSPATASALLDMMYSNNNHAIRTSLSMKGLVGLNEDGRARVKSFNDLWEHSPSGFNNFPQSKIMYMFGSDDFHNRYNSSNEGALSQLYDEAYAELSGIPENSYYPDGMAIAFDRNGVEQAIQWSRTHRLPFCVPAKVVRDAGLSPITYAYNAYRKRIVRNGRPVDLFVFNPSAHEDLDNIYSSKATSKEKPQINDVMAVMVSTPGMSMADAGSLINMDTAGYITIEQNTIESNSVDHYLGRGVRGVTRLADGEEIKAAARKIADGDLDDVNVRYMKDTLKMSDEEIRIELSRFAQWMLSRQDAPSVKREAYPGEIVTFVVTKSGRTGRNVFTPIVLERSGVQDRYRNIDVVKTGGIIMIGYDAATDFADNLRGDGSPRLYCHKIAVDGVAFKSMGTPIEPGEFRRVAGTEMPVVGASIGGQRAAVDIVIDSGAVTGRIEGKDQANLLHDLWYYSHGVVAYNPFIKYNEDGSISFSDDLVRLIIGDRTTYSRSVLVDLLAGSGTKDAARLVANGVLPLSTDQYVNKLLKNIFKRALESDTYPLALIESAQLSEDLINQLYPKIDQDTGELTVPKVTLKNGLVRRAPSIDFQMTLGSLSYEDTLTLFHWMDDRLCPDPRSNEPDDGSTVFDYNGNTLVFIKDSKTGNDIPTRQRIFWGPVLALGKGSQIGTPSGTAKRGAQQRASQAYDNGMAFADTDFFVQWFAELIGRPDIIETMRDHNDLYPKDKIIAEDIGYTEDPDYLNRVMSARFMSRRQELHWQKVSEAGRVYRKPLPFQDADGNVIDDPGALMGDSYVAAAVSRLNKALRGDGKGNYRPLTIDEVLILYVNASGQTLTGKPAKKYPSIKQLTAFIEEMAENVETDGIPVKARRTSTDDKSRYSIALLPREFAYELFYRSPAIRSKNDNSFDAFSKKMHDEQKTCIDMIKAIKDEGKRKELFRMCDWTSLNWGEDPDTSHIYEDMYLSDMIDSNDTILKAAGEYMFSPKQIKWFRDNAKIQAEKIAAIAKRNDMRNRKSLKDPDSRNGEMLRYDFRDYEGGERFLCNLAEMSRFMSMLNPFISVANILDRAIHQGTTDALMAWSMNHGVGPYKSNFVPNRTAVLMGADSLEAQKVFDVIRYASYDGDEARVLSSINSMDDINSYLSDRESALNSQKLFFIPRKAVEWVFEKAGGGNVMAKYQRRNWFNQFARIISSDDFNRGLDGEPNPLLQKISENGLTLLEHQWAQNPAQLLVSVFRNESNPYHSAAVRALNFSRAGEATQNNILYAMYSGLAKKYPAVEFFTTTCISRFFLYSTNMTGRILNLVAPISAVNYMLTNFAMRMDTDNKFNFGDLQIYTSFKEALLVDVTHMAPAVVAILLASISGLFMPPEDEDKRGDYNEWLIGGRRIGEDWMLKDILGLSGPLACFFAGVFNGDTRFDLVWNGFLDCCYSNPILRAGSLFNLFADPESSFTADYEEDAARYEDAPGGSPDMLSWLGGRAFSGMLSWGSQFITPSIARELSNAIEFQPYERAYRYTVAKDARGNPIIDPDTGMYEYQETTYLDAQIRRVTRTNPVLGLAMDVLTGSWITGNTGYTAWEQPRTVYYDDAQLESMRLFSVNGENGEPLPADQQQEKIYMVISMLMAYDDMDDLASTGFYLDYDTKMAVGETIHDIIQTMRDDYSEMNAAGFFDYYYGGLDYESGRARSEMLKAQYYDELQFWQDLYYNKLWSEPMKRTLTVYNRYNTTYTQDANGEWYATGIYNSINPFYHNAPGDIDNPGGTAGYSNDWRTVSAVTGQPMDQRALIPVEAGYLDTPDLDGLGDASNGGYSKSFPGWSYSNSIDGDGYDYGGGGWGWRRYGSGGGGGGGGGYRPNIYSRVPNVYPSGARTMYAERIYGPNYDYLRPNFETKGSREAYKRSDI